MLGVTTELRELINFLHRVLHVLRGSLFEMSIGTI
jgi:hypothetical protein